MANIAQTPPPPYYAVIFTSIRNSDDGIAYGHTAERMVELAQQQPGYLGAESARNDIGITVSYWDSLEAIRNWKMNTEHLVAQEMGQKAWYTAYQTRICKVERDYSFNTDFNRSGDLAVNPDI
jgi:heme-degrading monooxygenase HmoA